MNNHFTSSNIIISSIILTVVYYLYYQYSQKNIENFQSLEENQLEKEKEPRITSKHIDKYIQKEFSKVLKIFAKEVQNTAKSMSEFNHDFLLKSDYLNFRNSLFTKDIEKQLILVDSRSIDHSIAHNTSDYKICLDGSDTSCNPTGGFGVFKNVIGFRLVKAVIPSTSFVVNDFNNKLSINIYNGGTLQVNNKPIILEKGAYTGFTLSHELSKRINHADIGNQKFLVGFINSESKLKFSTENTTATKADIFDLEDEIEIRDRIKELTTLQPNRFLIFFNGNKKFEINTEIDNSAYRLFGFLKNQKNPSTSIEYKSDNGEKATLISPHNADHANHFVDIVVKEIPYIACKKNPRGRMVVDRIPITTRQGSIVEYQSPTSEYFSQNYFYPISLDHLSIQIYQDSSEHLYDTSNLDNYFEFELKMLKNTKNLNHVVEKNKN